jgi:hypothetical protein
VVGLYIAVMPRFRASRPVRNGVLWAFRSRAAVDVLLSAGLPGRCAKRSGRGVFVDLIVRMHVYEVAATEGCAGIRERIDEGSRNAGGNKPQLRGALGGIV